LGPYSAAKVQRKIHRTMVRCSLIVCVIILLAGSIAHAEECQVRVFRTFMPGAGPSAFGVVLNAETVLCYDPLRGGVNQVWRGTLDLAPTLQAKINPPAEIKGTIFYEEKTVQPLRVNDARKVPERRLRGYVYEKNGVTFHYTLDGIGILETLLATDDGRGLERRWTIPSGVTLYLIADQQADAQVTIQGGIEVSRGTWKFLGAPGVAISMKIEPRR
jgi:hypothetical protein